MAEGQYTGQRKTYIYVSEDGTEYALKLDVTLAEIPGTGLITATQNNPGINKPLRFKPRVVFWEGTLNSRKVRKSIVCSFPSTLYGASSSAELTIDGVAGATTGRRGEKMSYASLDPAEE